MERYRTTLVLGGVLIVLVVLAFFLTNKNTVTTGTETPVPNVYIWEDANPVKALEIMSGTNKVGLTKDVVLGTWHIDAPVDKPADIFQVGGVADSLQRLQAQYTLSDTTDLAQYGLAGQPLQITATYSDTAGTKRSLLIGNATPDGSAYYVKTPDNAKVYTVVNSTIEPVRTWLTAPPIQPPSPTPVPITPVTATPTGTDTATPVVPAGVATATATPGSASAPNAPTATTTP